MEPGILPYTSYACSIQRWCGGEGQWKTHFVNESKDAAIIGLTPNRPGKVRRRKNEWALKCECVRPSCLFWRSPIAQETFSCDFSGTHLRRRPNRITPVPLAQGGARRHGRREGGRLGWPLLQAGRLDGLHGQGKRHEWPFRDHP